MAKIPFSLQLATWLHLAHSIVNATGVVGQVHICASPAGDIVLIFGVAILVVEPAEWARRGWKWAKEVWKRWRG